MKVFVIANGTGGTEGIVCLYWDGAPDQGGGYVVDPTGCKTPHEFQDRIVRATLAALDNDKPGHGVKPHEVCVPSFTRG